MKSYNIEFGRFANAIVKDARSSREAEKKLARYIEAKSNEEILALLKDSETYITCTERVVGTPDQITVVGDEKVLEDLCQEESLYSEEDDEGIIVYREEWQKIMPDTFYTDSEGKRYRLIPEQVVMVPAEDEDTKEGPDEEDIYHYTVPTGQEENDYE